MNDNNFEKGIWTNDDFEEMEWHDNKIYAIAFGIKKFEISFDIDYILKWISPIENENSFKFLVGPVTLVFKNVHGFSIDFPAVDIIIDSIYRDNPTTPKNSAFIKEQFEYDWTIQTTNGEIYFKSVGYNQYLRQPPKILDSPIIDFEQRGGISFDIKL